METRPPEQRFWMVPFTVLATRGLLRDARNRRKIMAIALFGAIVILVAGLTVLRGWLDPNPHPWRFLLFWMACGWAIILVFLLAIFDLLMVRAEARAARKLLREELSRTGVQRISEEIKEN